MFFIMFEICCKQIEDLVPYKHISEKSLVKADHLTFMNVLRWISAISLIGYFTELE